MEWYDKVSLRIYGDRRVCDVLVAELDKIALRPVRSVYRKHYDNRRFNFIISNASNYCVFASYVVSRSKELGPGFKFTLTLRSNPEKELCISDGKAEIAKRPCRLLEYEPDGLNALESTVLRASGGFLG